MLGTILGEGGTLVLPWSTRSRLDPKLAGATQATVRHATEDHRAGGRQPTIRHRLRGRKTSVDDISDHGDGCHSDEAGTQKLHRRSDVRNRSSVATTLAHQSNDLPAGHGDIGAAERNGEGGSDQIPARMVRRREVCEFVRATLEVIRQQVKAAQGRGKKMDPVAARQIAVAETRSDV